MEQKPGILCTKCGMQFKLQKYLDQHNKRKTPCGIIEDKGGEHRCIYCNKTYFNKYNLAKHTKNCQMKNGGVAKIPDPNIRLAEQVRILAEEHKKEKEKMEKEIAEISAMMKEMLLRQPVQSVGDVNNGTSIVVTNNITQNINVNVYTRPNIQYYLDNPQIMIPLINQKDTDLHMSLIQSTWYNTNHPENHSVIADRNGTCKVKGEFGWEIITLDTAAIEVRKTAIDLAVGVMGEITPHKKSRAAILHNSRNWVNALALEETAKVKEGILLGTKLIDDARKGVAK